MKRIAFILPRMGIGGVERSFLGLLRSAPREKVDITLILLEQGGELLEEVPDWVHIQYALAGGTEKLRGTVSATLKRLRLDKLFQLAKSAYHALGPKLMRGRRTGEFFDVAVAYNDGMATWYTANSVKAKHKIAFIHTDFQKAGYNPATERKGYQAFEQIVFVSEQARKGFLELLPEFGEKTGVLPNCVDRDRILRLAKEPVDLPDDKRLKIMTVGRLSHEKGVDKLPPLLERLTVEGFDVRWYVIGDGPERENLLAEAKRLGVEERLVLTGALRNPYPYMAAADIYVQPSDYEGYCIALAEARLLERPCVACDFAGAREQLQDGVTGFITGLDVGELYEKISLLLKDRELRKSFSDHLVGQTNEARENSATIWWKRLILE